MNKIKIITDSAATLSPQLIQENNIGIVDLKVIWPEEKVEGSLKSKELFQKMRATQSEAAPKTSQPSVGDFKKAFEEAFREGYKEIICSVISTGISGTFNSANQAVEFLSEEERNKVSVIDSFNVDGGEGLIALKVFELAQKGETRAEIISKIEEFKHQVKVVGLAGDPKWIERNGRLSHAGASLIRKLEKIGVRPLLTLKNGKVAVTAIKFKAKDKVFSIVRELKEAVGEKEGVATLSHADMLSVAEKIKKQLAEVCPHLKILFIKDVNPIIGCHLGPDSIICCYYLKENDVL